MLVFYLTQALSLSLSVIYWNELLWASLNGATTLNRTTFSTTKTSIATLSTVTLNLTILNCTKCFSECCSFPVCTLCCIILFRFLKLSIFKLECRSPWSSLCWVYADIFYADCRNAECHYTQRLDILIAVMLGVIMLSFVAQWPSAIECISKFDNCKYDNVLLFKRNEIFLGNFELATS